MKDHLFKISMVVLVVGFLSGAVLLKGDSPERIRLGTEQADNGREHVAQNEAPEYGEATPPTSGNHGEPIPKGAYTQELPDYNTIHNLEHGYIYVSYSPDLPQEEIAKLNGLFFTPYSREDFSPTKVIMAPRAANEAPIVLSSWQREQTFEQFDEQTMIDYYMSNVNKSPEPTAS